MKRIRFLLVGPGKVGTSLGAAWVREGHRCVGVEGGSPAARRRARRLLRAPETGGEAGAAPPKFDLLLLAVPDGAIVPLARIWRKRCSWKGRVVLHTSGALGSSVLETLRRRGAMAGSLHPLFSFARPALDRTAFHGVFFGIEGDPGAARMARRLARDVGGRQIEIGADGKALYHLGACLSSGYLLGLIDAAASRIPASPAGRARLRLALLALAESTLRNARELGLERALTGPIVRGDTGTIRIHLGALQRSPAEWQWLHRALAQHLLRLTLRSGRITPATAARIRSLLATGR